MKAASERSETLLKSLRAHVGEAERRQEFIGHMWSASTESRPGAEPRWQAAPPVSTIPFAVWGGWARRGIPELASPLAD